MFEKNGYTLNAANEIEGFLFDGIDAERKYHETGTFEYVNKGGYYHSLPGDPLREFIDATAEVQRAMGFENEKDHPEVAPSQFEINYSYGEVVAAADQIQLYKLICRQVATQMGMTASFLPKPVVGVNGIGMHTNVSVTKGGKNLFWDPKGEEKISKLAWQFVDRILTHGNDICLLMNCERECVSPAGSALRGAEPDQGFGGRTAARWCGFRSATRSRRASRCARWLRMRTRTWCCTRSSRPASRRYFEDQEPASGGALSAGQHLHGN